MYAMQQYRQRQRKRRLIIATVTLIVMATAIACIVAAAKSANASKTYTDKYSAKYENISKKYYDKYAKKWVDKYGSKTTLAPTTTEELTTETPGTTETEPTPGTTETEPTPGTTETGPTPEPTETRMTPERLTTPARTTGKPRSTYTRTTGGKLSQRTTHGFDYDKHTTNGHKAGSSIAGLLKHFGLKDAAEVTWAHAVNSEAKLDEALSNEKVMMIEADVVMDPVNEIPIMAHPPANSSDITLEEFLTHALKHSEEKGIKLDFKENEALNASVPIMKKLFEKRHTLPPVILNADILVGPNTNENETSPIDADLFFTKLAPFKKAILSPGWTTKDLGGNSTGYNNSDANEMTKLIQKNIVQQDLSFPMRASLLALNPKPAYILLNQMLAKTSITVWTSKTDVYDPKKLGFLRLFSKKVFYDLPAKDIQIIKESSFTANIPTGLIPDVAKKNMP